MLDIGGLYITAKEAAAAESQLLDGPTQSVYSGEGNMVRLGRSKTFASGIYNGIWGYATDDREYALQCHGEGLNIIDVTDATSPVRVQHIPMGGGGIWRDVATHADSTSGKTFAYVGAQGTQGGGTPALYVVDLSYLSGNISEPHAAEENPIPEFDGSGGYKRLVGYDDYGHTINVARGLLFMNDHRSSIGCRIYDLTADPWSPAFLFSISGIGKDCHDSYVREDIDGRDILFVSDGSGRKESIYDITDVDATTNQAPAAIGTTAQLSGIYAHESWLSEDNRYLFEFDENNSADCIVYDVSDLTSPVRITTFQYSEEDTTNALPHNGEVRGKYLFVAYYEAGLRVFDISNPFLPVEVGKVETYRDPVGDGTYTRSISGRGSTDGAWNTYPFLPSGNILVNDSSEGLFVVKADAPYEAPSAVQLAAQRDGLDDVTLTWDDVTNARGYSVERSFDGSAYTMIAEHLVSSTYSDSSSRFQDAWYKVNAVNGEGVSTSSVVESPGGVLVCENLTTQADCQQDTSCAWVNFRGNKSCETTSNPSPTSAPGPGPAPPTSCLPKGTACPADPNNCCSSTCVQKGRNFKCS
ncbi:hypothetical protein ACHAXR_012646 [Thalassiosira sp. AJA248-18]